MKSVTKTSSLRALRSRAKQSQNEIASSHSTKSGMLLAMTVAFLFCTLYPEPCPLTYAAEKEYNGGSGAGYAMDEFTGRLDGNYGQPQSVRNNEPQISRTKEPIFSGGPGAGYAMAEYMGPIDDSKKKPRKIK